MVQELKKIILRQVRCTRCGYVWFPRILGETVIFPKFCAKCNSPYWNLPYIDERGPRSKHKG